MRRAWRLVAALFLVGCSKRTEPPTPVATPSCAEVSVTSLPTATHPHALGRYRLTLPTDGATLRKHEARFAKRGITPNGEAWAGLLEQCLGKEGTPLPRDVHPDPEAGALSLWAATERSRDAAQAALCRAVNDEAWLDACLAKVDRAALDD